MKRLTLRNISIITLSFFIFIFSIETSARIDDFIHYKAPLFGDYSSVILRTIDSEGIPINRPDVRFEKWRNNNQGFRGFSVAEVKSSESKRIACMGTSETYGLHENENMEWPAQLNGMLSQYGDIEVFNAARVGLGMTHFIPYIEKYVKVYEPDYMIVLINPFQYANSREEQSNNVKNERRQKTIHKTNISTYNFSEIVKNLRFIKKIKQAFQSVIPENLLKKYQLSKTIKQVETIEKSTLKNGNAKDKLPNEHIESFKSDVNKLVHYLKENNITPILCSYPSLVSDENYLNHPEIILDLRRFTIYYSVEGLTDVLYKLNKVVEGVANVNSVLFVDLNGKLNHDKKYFADSVHYTDTGAELVAKNLSEAFTRAYIYPKMVSGN